MFTTTKKKITTMLENSFGPIFYKISKMKWKRKKNKM